MKISNDLKKQLLFKCTKISILQELDSNMLYLNPLSFIRFEQTKLRWTEEGNLIPSYFTSEKNFNIRNNTQKRKA